MMVDLKQIIKNRRAELGCSQAKLGKLVGKNDAFISRIEQGEGKDISIDMLAKIAYHLKLDLMDMLIDAGYISDESLRKHQLLNQLDCDFLTEQDCSYVNTFVDSLISKRRNEAKK